MSTLLLNYRESPKPEAVLPLFDNQGDVIHERASPRKWPQRGQILTLDPSPSRTHASLGIVSCTR